MGRSRRIATPLRTSVRWKRRSIPGANSDGTFNAIPSSNHRLANVANTKRGFCPASLVCGRSQRQSGYNIGNFHGVGGICKRQRQLCIHLVHGAL